jgi:hypothetical protein
MYLTQQGLIAYARLESHVAHLPKRGRVEESDDLFVKVWDPRLSASATDDPIVPA